MAKLIREGGYDVLLPTHEQVYLLSRFRDAFTPHVGLALPEFAAMERMQNKAEFSRLLIELDLPQPDVAIVRTRADLDRPWQYPFYLKLAHSTAGGGVFHIENRGELIDASTKSKRKGLFGNGSEAARPATGARRAVHRASRFQPRRNDRRPLFRGAPTRRRRHVDGPHQRGSSDRA